MREKHVFERVRPEQVGISSNSIINFLDNVNDKQINMHSFMLLRHGKVAAEGFYKPFDDKTLYNIFSVSKSVTSAAVGIAIGEGLLSLDDRVVDFFPEKLPGNVYKYTSMMKVRHLLSMATVHPKSTDTKGDDWVWSFLNTTPAHFPGTVFAYDTTGTHTLCAIIQKITGMTVHEYLKTRLFEPIGIGEIEWESCPMNINKGGSGIKCTTEDLARFGQLYLQKGVWDDTRILPEGWVEFSTKRHIDNSNTKTILDGNKGYAYLFWRTRNNSYCAFGMGGQFIVVIPDKDVIFISTANTLKYKDGQQMILDSLWETLYPAMSDEPLPGNSIVYEKLKLQLDNLTLILPEGKDQSPIVGQVSGKRFKLLQNNLGYYACEFDFNTERSTLSLYKDSDRFDIVFGMNRCITGIEPFFGLEAAGAATWVDDKTCIINVQILESLQMFTLTCRFEEQCLVIQMQPIGVLNAGKLDCFLNGSF